MLYLYVFKHTAIYNYFPYEFKCELQIDSTLIGCQEHKYIPNKVEKEIRSRIRLSVAAYAYEFMDAQIMSDAEFDARSREIDLDISTGNELIDKFFREKFLPCTGMWIREHLELSKIEDLYSKYYKN